MPRERQPPRSTAPAAASRATRSQGGDLPSTAPQPTTRTTRGTRQASAESTGSTGSRKATTRRGARAQVTDVLPLVAEVPTPAAAQATKSPLAELRAQALLDSPGIHSNLSGPTAHSNPSDNEADDLDPDMLVAEAAQLYSAAEALLKLVAPTTTALARGRSSKDGTREQISKYYKLIKQRARTLKTQQSVYVAPSTGLFIQTSPVLKAIRSSVTLDDAVTGPFQELLYKANLADFAAWLVVSEEESIDITNPLGELDQHFPSLFLSSFLRTEHNGASVSAAPGSSGLLSETFSLALQLRTQLALSRLESKSESAESVLLSCFFEQDQEADGPRVKGWPSHGLETPLHRKYQDQVRSRVEKIRSTFANNGESVDFETLAHDFSWHGFVLQALSWVQARDRELSTSIEARGGAQNVVDTFEARLHETPDKTKVTAPSANAQSDAAETISTRKAKRKSLNDDPFVKGAASWLKTNSPSVNPSRTSQISQQQKDAVAFLKMSKNEQLPPYEATRPRADQADAISAVTTSAEAGEAVGAELDELPPQFSDPIGHEEEIAHEVLEPIASSAAERLEKIKQREAQDKPRFIDPQNAAQRVEWESQAVQDRPAGAFVGRKPGVIKRSRPFEEDEEDVSEDEGFQRDTRVLETEARRRERPAPTQSLPAQKRPRFEEPPTVRPTPAGPSSIARPASSAPPGTSGISQAYEQVRLLAQQADVTAPRKVQIRSAWTPRETRALLDYIVLYGCSWSRIKELDSANAGAQHLLNRDQVALKDKARNMRFDFHKAQVTLPSNFDAITLSKSQIDRLRALGLGVF